MTDLSLDELPEDADDSFDSFLKKVAHVSGPGLVGLGLRLKPGDLLREGRLRIDRRLGEGGMGVVYEAFDNERQEPVALKTFSRVSAEGIYRLKNEFRSLTGVSHPNLCRLYELFSSDGDWFFTMELVRGVRFNEYVRPAGVLDEPRLRAAMGSLREGIEAIHAAGKLHRDLKPSNVLVTETGRVVVLDFGLVSDNEQGGFGPSVADSSVSGTPAYMAPEQAGGMDAVRASDWYAFGVMVYEALTGRIPFDDGAAHIIDRKQHEDAPRASSSASVPDDLDALCVRLLSRDPTQRLLEPSTAAPGAAASASAGVSQASTARRLIGREAELALLQEAYRASLRGAPQMVLVSGESGMGKTALVSSFLEGLDRAGSAVVFSGRCYERENVPFRGFDALVDNMSSFLRRCTREEAAALLPRDVAALARLFPVLERVALVAEAPTQSIADPQELRRRAFAAFGELLGRIRDRGPLCIYIDDVQWLDADSVLFMRSLLVDRDQSPLLFVTSYRSEELARNERLAAVIDAARSNERIEVTTITVAPLGQDAASTLAQRSLGDRMPELADAIAREAGGSPFFVAELARHAARSGGALLSLAEVVDRHLTELTPAARTLLEMSALAGQPLPTDTLLAASDARHDSLDELRARQLLRVDVKDRTDLLSCYHDRIREAVSGMLLENGRVRLFDALARTLLRDETTADPDLVTTCLEGAGDRVRAAHYAGVAADRAERNLAFDRAAELYRKALSLDEQSSPQRKARLTGLGHALSNAGRGREAAESYLAAAERSEGSEDIDLRRRAAEELLSSGYANEGEELMRRVAREVGLRVPRGVPATIASLLWSQTRIRFTSFEPNGLPPKTLSSMDRLRLDTLTSLTRFSTVSMLLLAWSNDHLLLSAKATRHPESLVRGLALHGANAVATKPRDEARNAAIFALARKHAEPLGRADLHGVIDTLEGMGIMFGRTATMTPDSSRSMLRRAVERLASSRGFHYELDLANIYRVQVVDDDLQSEVRWIVSLIEQSFALGRIWVALALSSIGSMSRLALGDLGGASRDLERASEAWKGGRLTEMGWADLMLKTGGSLVASYSGQRAELVEEFERDRRWFNRSPIHVAELARASIAGHGGALTLAHARQQGISARYKAKLMARVKAHRETLSKTPGHAFPYFELALHVGSALAAGQRDGAITALRSYIAKPPVAPNPGKLDQIAARRRLAQLLGGEQGAILLAAADDEMRARGVADNERTTEMVLPGTAPVY